MRSYFGRNMLFFVMLLSIGGLLYFFLMKPNLDSSAEEKSDLKTFTVKMGDVVDLMRLRGRITADKQHQVFSETTGQIIEIKVDVGDKVEEGDLLLKFDQERLVYQLEKKRMALKKAAIALRNQDETYARNQALYTEKFIPETELEASKKSFDMAKIDYEMEETELNSFTRQLDKADVKAPTAGIITRREVNEGDIIEMSSDNLYGSILFEITDIESLKIDVAVNGIERQKLSIGKNIEFWLDTDPNKRYQGSISDIGSASFRQDNVGSFKVEISIDQDTGNLLLGAGANVEIIVDEAKGVPLVPTEGIFFEGRGRYVYLVKDPGYEKRNIEVGVSSTDFVEVLQGLSEGDRVYLDEPL
jgi:RND family efflux transporter MFP subunit